MMVMTLMVMLVVMKNDAEMVDVCLHWSFFILKMIQRLISRKTMYDL